MRRVIIEHCRQCASCRASDGLDKDNLPLYYVCDSVHRKRLRGSVSIIINGTIHDPDGYIPEFCPLPWVEEPDGNISIRKRFDKVRLIMNFVKGQLDNE
jgi:hypothetical protein